MRGGGFRCRATKTNLSGFFFFFLGGGEIFQIRMKKLVTLDRSLHMASPKCKNGMEQRNIGLWLNIGLHSLCHCRSTVGPDPPMAPNIGGHIYVYK